MQFALDEDMASIDRLILFNSLIFGIPFGLVLLRTFWRRYGHQLFLTKWVLSKFPNGRIVRRFLLPKSRALQSATPSRDLVPLISPYIVNHSKSGSLLWTVGTDTFYFDGENGNFWHSWLCKWESLGCSITYIILPSSEEGNMSECVDSKTPSNLKIKLRHLKVSEDKSIQKLQKRYETFHPTILTDIHGEPLAAWIENYHPVRRTVAHDVEFLDTVSVRNDPRILQIMIDIQRLLESDNSKIESMAA